MTTGQTSFDIEDAEILLKSLQQFNETLQQEWSRVLNQWSNLEQTWHDEQSYQFQPLFEQLSNTYKNEQQECENYIDFLKRQIEVARKTSDQLGSLGN